MGGFTFAAHRRKNRGFSTLKRTLDLGVEKGRLLQNSRPNVGGYTRYFSVRMPETIDITGFFKKFCIATRTRSSTQVGTRFFMPGKRPSPLRGRYPFYLPQGWRDSPESASLFFKSIHLLEIWNPPPVCTQKSGSPLGKPLFDRTCFAPAYGRFFMLEPFHRFLRPSGVTP